MPARSNLILRVPLVLLCTGVLYLGCAADDTFRETHTSLDNGWYQLGYRTTTNDQWWYRPADINRWPVKKTGVLLFVNPNTRRATPKRFEFDCAARRYTIIDDGPSFSLDNWNYHPARLNRSSVVMTLDVPRGHAYGSFYRLVCQV